MIDRDRNCRLEKKAVIGSVFHWESRIHNGAHHIAKQFFRHGYNVGYVSEPISPLHYLFAKDRAVFRERHANWIKGGNLVNGGNLWSYTPMFLFPPQRKFFSSRRWIVKNDYRLSIPSMKSVLNKNGFDRAEIIFLDESYVYLLDLIKSRKTVLRLNENIICLYEQNARELLQRTREVIQRVDLVVITARALEDLAKEYGAKNVVYIPGGTDVQSFIGGDVAPPQEYKNIPSPRAVFVGNIAYWVDIDLIAYLSKKLPDVSFLFIGTPNIDMAGLRDIPNFHFLGSRSHDDLPRYLKHADVGIIPFRTDLPRTHFVHPIKLYEYMACGLPVVSTRWQELEAMESPALLSDTQEEFAANIMKALNVRDRGHLIEFALKNSWDSRFDRLMQVLGLDEDRRTPHIPPFSHPSISF